MASTAVTMHDEAKKIGPRWLKSDPTTEAMGLLDLLADTRTASERLESIELGGTVELPFDQETFANLLDGCRRWTEDDERLVGEFGPAPAEVA
jgi:hypothetical protein